MSYFQLSSPCFKLWWSSVSRVLPYITLKRILNVHIHNLQGVSIRAGSQPKPLASQPSSAGYFHLIVPLLLMKSYTVIKMPLKKPVKHLFPSLESQSISSLTDLHMPIDSIIALHVCSCKGLGTSGTLSLKQFPVLHIIWWNNMAHYHSHLRFLISLLLKTLVTALTCNLQGQFHL